MLRKLWTKNIALLELIPSSKYIHFERQDWHQYTSNRHSLLIPDQECNPCPIHEKITRLAIPHSPDSYSLPRNFSFLVPLLISGMSTPTCKKDVQALDTIGVRHCVTLTAESPLQESWFHDTNVVHTFWPIENYYPVSVGHMDAFVGIVASCIYPFEKDQAGSVLVHCGGTIFP